MDYLKASGATGFYHPDWVVVQKTGTAEINWIVETKGRVWEGTEAKNDAIGNWCERVSECTGSKWKFKRVNQRDFDARKPASVTDAIGVKLNKALL